MTGRKPKYSTPEDMQVMIDLWVADCQANEKMMTLPNLCLALGFSSRQSLADYQDKVVGDKGETPFADTIKNARLLVEENTLQRAVKSNGAGAIFYLKNLGYTDRQIVQVEPVKLTISGEDAKL